MGGHRRCLLLWFVLLPLSILAATPTQVQKKISLISRSSHGAFLEGGDADDVQVTSYSGTGGCVALNMPIVPGVSLVIDGLVSSEMSTTDGRTTIEVTAMAGVGIGIPFFNVRLEGEITGSLHYEGDNQPEDALSAVLGGLKHVAAFSYNKLMDSFFANEKLSTDANKLRRDLRIMASKMRMFLFKLKHAPVSESARQSLEEKNMVTLQFAEATKYKEVVEDIIIRIIRAKFDFQAQAWGVKEGGVEEYLYSITPQELACFPTANGVLQALVSVVEEVYYAEIRKSIIAAETLDLYEIWLRTMASKELTQVLHTYMPKEETKKSLSWPNTITGFVNTIKDFTVKADGTVNTDNWQQLFPNYQNFQALGRIKDVKAALEANRALLRKEPQNPFFARLLTALSDDDAKSKLRVDLAKLSPGPPTSGSISIAGTLVASVSGSNYDICGAGPVAMTGKIGKVFKMTYTAGEWQSTEGDVITAGVLMDDGRSAMTWVRQRLSDSSEQTSSDLAASFFVPFVPFNAILTTWTKIQGYVENIDPCVNPLAVCDAICLKIGYKTVDSTCVGVDLFGPQRFIDIVDHGVKDIIGPLICSPSTSLKAWTDTAYKAVKKFITSVGGMLKKLLQNVMDRLYQLKKLGIMGILLSVARNFVNGLDEKEPLKKPTLAMIKKASDLARQYQTCDPKTFAEMAKEMMDAAAKAFKDADDLLKKGERPSNRPETDDAGRATIADRCAAEVKKGFASAKSFLIDNAAGGPPEAPVAGDGLALDASIDGVIKDVLSKLPAPIKEKAKQEIKAFVNGILPEFAVLVLSLIAKFTALDTLVLSALDALMPRISPLELHIGGHIGFSVSAHTCPSFDYSLRFGNFEQLEASVVGMPVRIKINNWNGVVLNKKATATGADTSGSMAPSGAEKLYEIPLPPSVKVTMKEIVISGDQMKDEAAVYIFAAQPVPVPSDIGDMTETMIRDRQPLWVLKNPTMSEVDGVAVATFKGPFAMNLPDHIGLDFMIESEADDMPLEPARWVWFLRVPHRALKQQLNTKQSVTEVAWPTGTIMKYPVEFKATSTVAFSSATEGQIITREESNLFALGAIACTIEQKWVRVGVTLADPLNPKNADWSVTDTSLGWDYDYVFEHGSEGWPTVDVFLTSLRYKISAGDDEESAKELATGEIIPEPREQEVTKEVKVGGKDSCKFTMKKVETMH